MSVFMKTPAEITLLIAKQAQERRLALNLSQQSLAIRAGVSYGTLKKFERTGQISLLSLLKIALSLDCLENFDNLFKIPETALRSLDELLKKKRKRGRE